MIPWFIVTLVGWMLRPFNRDVYVTAVSGNRWGAERIHLVRRAPGEPWPARVGPYRGGPLLPGGLVEPVPGTVLVTPIGAPSPARAC